MGFNDRYPEDYIEHNVVCCICGKKFRFITEEQTPGFRTMDELHCPYCKTLLAQSMEVEFSGIQKLEDEEKNKNGRKKNNGRSFGKRIRKD